jgi:DNA-binding IclR family transcriptional regulator
MLAPRSTSPNPERYVIPNLRNACRILKLLGRQRKGLKAADLARELKVPVTTTLRIMSTLCLEGLARKVDGRFELGPVLIQLGDVALAGTEVRDLAQPLLLRLTELTDETSHLAIPCDDRALIVAVQDSPHPLRAASRPGFLADLHCSATGKIFLAYLHRDRLAGILEENVPVPRTPATLTSVSAIKKEVDLTRKRGFSLDNEEFHLGVRCLAAPVFASDGTVIAAMGITAATLRFPKDRIPEIAAKVNSIAQELSRLLGHVGSGGSLKFQGFRVAGSAIFVQPVFLIALPARRRALEPPRCPHPRTDDSFTRPPFHETPRIPAHLRHRRRLRHAGLGRPYGRGLLPNTMVRDLIRANDARVPALLATQIRTPDKPDDGGVRNEYGFATAGGTAGSGARVRLRRHLAGVALSRVQGAPRALRLAAAYLLGSQHPDGTIDLYATNFASPPDTAFVLELLAPACALLRRSKLPEGVAVGAEVGRFVTRAADGLVVGGVHTPNHRWVVCAALAWAHSLFPNPRYLGRIDQWMAEKIDIDPDGQYTEKSTTVYSPVVDRALVTVARLLGRPALLDPVRRNLEMTLYYLHPDGEVATEASLRQDRSQRGTVSRYYYPYRYLALHDGNGRFAAIARQIERQEPGHLTGELSAFLLEPELSRPLPPDAALPTDFAKVFAYSSLARIRRGSTSITVLGQNTTLLTYRKGAAVLDALRIATAFFGKGQFTSESLVEKNGVYVLRQSLSGPYFQPLSAAQIASGEHVKMAPNGTLANMGKAIRAESNVQRLTSVITVTEAAAG